jgi:DNA-binding PadR family transcriptional regulator
MKNENSFPPLTPAVFAILLALGGGEGHGYQIMKQVAADFGRKVTMGPGTLYGSIKRMLAHDLVEEVGDRPDPELGDERRRYYRLTERGHQHLAAELGRYQQALRVARQRALLPVASAAPEQST